MMLPKEHPNACPRCRGLGWLYVKPSGRGQEWPVPCNDCEGMGYYRTMNLARFLGVDHRDIWKVRANFAGKKVAMRVLSAIAERLPEALR